MDVEIIEGVLYGSSGDVQLSAMFDPNMKEVFGPIFHGTGEDVNRFVKWFSDSFPDINMRSCSGNELSILKDIWSNNSKV
jgi:hypothetical protein